MRRILASLVLAIFLVASAPQSAPRVRIHNSRSAGETAIDETHSYINTLFQLQPGDTVTLTVVRQGQPLQVQVHRGHRGSGLETVL